MPASQAFSPTVLSRFLLISRRYLGLALVPGEMRRRSFVRLIRPLRSIAVRSASHKPLPHGHGGVARP